jgi:ubiquinone/menaquinone biosynthesis C-methylase UbiE
MERVFNPINKKKLDSPRKREVLPPNEVLNDAGIASGDYVADIGCGIGYFTFPAAEIIGSSGRVFAVDIAYEMIEEIEKRTANCGYETVRAVLSTPLDNKLPDGLCDFALLSTILHEVDEVDVFLRDTKRILKEDGKIVVIDWVKRESDWGPRVGHRISSDECADMLRNSGFNPTITKIYGDDFYMVVAERA